MAVVHLLLAVATAGAGVLLALTSLYAVVVGRYPRVVVDRIVLGQLLVTLLTGLAGGGVFATSRPPSDALHVLYGVAALAATPVARYVAREGTPRRRGSLMLVGSVVLLAVVARAFMTAA